MNIGLNDSVVKAWTAGYDEVDAFNLESGTLIAICRDKQLYTLYRCFELGDSIQVSCDHRDLSSFDLIKKLALIAYDSF